MEKQTRNYGPIPFLEREGVFIKDILIDVGGLDYNKFSIRASAKIRR